MIHVRVTAKTDCEYQEGEGDWVISGISTIEEIAPGMIRARYFADSFEVDGTPVRKIVANQVWSASRWIAAVKTALQVWENRMLLAEQPKGGKVIALVH